MPGPEKVLVIIDPTYDSQHQPALKRAIINSKIRSSEEASNLTLMVAFEQDDASTENAEKIPSANWLEEIQQRLLKEGLNCEIVLRPSKEWANSILLTADKHRIDLIMVPFYKEKLADEKWRLLRNSSVPVVMVRAGSNAKRSTILAAIKAQDESYDLLNQKVIDRGRWSSRRYGADFHIVNAYDDSLEFPDRNKLARMGDIPHDHVHIRQGAPEEVIAEVAKKLDPDVLIVGTKRRSGFRAMLRSNTVEKIIARLDQDIMMIV